MHHYNFLCFTKEIKTILEGECTSLSEVDRSLLIESNELLKVHESKFLSSPVNRKVGVIERTSLPSKTLPRIP